MNFPPLVYYETSQEYRQHYKQHYCRGNIRTFDGIRVYFSPTRFDDAFYESKIIKNDTFSKKRACRINWIKATLEHEQAELYFGWNKHTGIDKKRRVAVVYEEFVVIIELKIAKNGITKGEFKTAYLADNSINKIRSGPKWSREEFERIQGISR